MRMPASKKRRTDQGQGLDGSLGLGAAHSPPLGSMQADNRRKKSAASRIGRACDRCQHRKLACDPAPDGCPPCQKVNAWCTVTDPLTGTPTYRGEFEYLEKRVASQQQDIEALLSRLRQLGHDDSDILPDETAEDERYKAWTQVKASGDTRPWDRDERSPGVARRSGPPPLSRVFGAENSGIQDQRKASVDSEPKQVSSSPELPEPLGPESYVGLTTSRGNPVSSRLNLYGLEIDLADFTAPDADDRDESPGSENPVYDRSYSSSYATIYGLQPRLNEPDLPPKVEFMHYAGALIQVLNPYTPVLHKTKYWEMIEQSYGPGKNATIARKAIFHLTCANVKMHMAARNQDHQKVNLDRGANEHYHYILGHFGKLLSGDTIEHVQALVMVCLFTRNFPKPEMCWALSNRIFGRLIELSYHRAPKRQKHGGDDLSTYEEEMQKRLFWITLSCAVNTCGKLGRPMPLRAEDFDVEIPASVADDALTDTGIDESKLSLHCEIKPHIEIAKLTPVYMEVYSTIYTAKRSKHNYRAFVESIEAKLRRWREQWPSEYRSEKKDNDLDKMSVAFLNFFSSELRLLLHHPSLSMTKGGHLNTEDLRICLTVSHEMLRNVKEMQRLRALEGTWHNCSIFMLAIQTTLYGHKMLKEEITAKKLDELKADMGAWLGIMRDMGTILGSGDKLQRSMVSQIQNGLAPLQQSVLQLSKASGRTAAPSFARQEAPLHREVKSEDPSLVTGGTAGAAHLPSLAYHSHSGSGNSNNSDNNNQQHTNNNSAGFSQLAASNYQQPQQQAYQSTMHSTPYTTYAEPSTTPISATFPSSGANLPPTYQTVPTTAGYGLGLQATHQLSHHHQSPATTAVNGYGSQQSPAAQPHTYGNGYYPPAYTQSAQEPPPSWLQYAQALQQASIGRGTGAVTSADFQPAAVSALLQLGATAAGPNSNNGLGSELASLAGATGTSFDNVGVGFVGPGIQEWPHGFLARSTYDHSRG